MVSELVQLNQLDCEIVAICYKAGRLKPASLKLSLTLKSVTVL